MFGFAPSSIEESGVGRKGSEGYGRGVVLVLFFAFLSLLEISERDPFFPVRYALLSLNLNYKR